MYKLSQPTGAAWIEIRNFGRRKNGDVSQPTRAAWIEIADILNYIDVGYLSQPTRAAWIEILPLNNHLNTSLSQPTRAAWIEIYCKKLGLEFDAVVAAHSGCVD